VVYHSAGLVHSPTSIRKSSTKMGNSLGDLVPKQALSNCRIVVVGPKSGDPSLLELSNLPMDARILATGCDVEEIRRDGDSFTEANVLLNISGNAAVLGPIINEMPFLKWFHSSHAGVEHIICPELLANEDIIVTNAKGVFSHSLGEYVIGSVLYFAKSFARLERQRLAHRWEKFNMELLPGKVMGIVGYGDIGRACAKYAKAFGMEVLALRRNPAVSTGDPLVDKVSGIRRVGIELRQ
jgi:lactate dehydrogenase-like 2-hydroxyacid dehydrogenase